MRVKGLNLRPAVLILLALSLIGYACARVEDNTRSGSLLVVQQVEGHSGDEDEDGTPLFSDICENEPPDDLGCVVFNDDALITFTNEFLQIGPGAGVGAPNFINDIIVHRYRVDYFRPNGRNTPGVDVPFGIDGTMNVRVPVNGTGSGTIVVVRHEAKKEPPLEELVNGPSEGTLTAQAQIKFFGQDISGRTVSATGFLEIHFAEFGE